MTTVCLFFFLHSLFVAINKPVLCMIFFLLKCNIQLQSHTRDDTLLVVTLNSKAIYQLQQQYMIRRRSLLPYKLTCVPAYSLYILCYCEQNSVLNLGLCLRVAVTCMVCPWIYTIHLLSEIIAQMYTCMIYIRRLATIRFLLQMIVSVCSCVNNLSQS